MVQRKTTGKGFTAATRASWVLSLYTAFPVEHTVWSGTILTASNGVQVAIDSTIMAPAAEPPTEGIASVYGTTLAAGAGANIPAGAISGGVL